MIAGNSVCYAVSLCFGIDTVLAALEALWSASRISFFVFILVELKEVLTRNMYYHESKGFCKGIGLLSLYFFMIWSAFPPHLHCLWLFLLCVGCVCLHLSDSAECKIFPRSLSLSGSFSCYSVWCKGYLDGTADIFNASVKILTCLPRASVEHRLVCILLSPLSIWN